MPYTIFVSSTFIDLEPHRKLVQETISKLRYNSQAMETFGALPDTPKEECLRLVRTASVYVGVFGMRYGSVDKETGKSLTQLEYEEASAIKLPRLIYLIDENNHPVLPKHVDTGSTAKKLTNLKTKLKKSHVISFFSSPENLAKNIEKDLTRLFNELSEAPSAQVLSQIASNSILRYPLTSPRFKFLKNKVSGFFNHKITDAILRESLELVLAGDNMAAAFVLSRGAPMPLNDAVDGLMEVEKILIEIFKKYKNPTIQEI